MANAKIAYKFLFRAAGEDPMIVIHETRPGDAEDCARKMAKVVAKKIRVPEVACVWMGPEDAKIPEKIRRELQKERVS